MKDLSPSMIFNRKGESISPLSVFPVNGNFIIGVYQGSITEYDILIKYRQKNNNKWSRIRTPKHIHWAVDIMLKMHSSPSITKDFLDVLLKTWDKTKGVKNESERQNVLKIKNLLLLNKNDISRYNSLSNQGEYSIKFLVLLAKLLMIQEKTNLEEAYMFKNLLKELKNNKDIFSIISKATHRGR
jgi:hypothetical protein